MRKLPGWFGCVFVLVCAAQASLVANDVACPCHNWNYEFPPRAIILPGLPREMTASGELRRQRQCQLRDLQRIELEIAYTQSEIKAYQRRLNELESLSRFKYSYGFSLDQEAAKLGLQRAQITLWELKQSHASMVAAAK